MAIKVEGPTIDKFDFDEAISKRNELKVRGIFLVPIKTSQLE